MENKNVYIVGVIAFLLGVVVGIAALYCAIMFRQNNGAQFGGTQCPAIARICNDSSVATYTGNGCETTCPEDGVSRGLDTQTGQVVNGQPINCPVGTYATKGTPGIRGVQEWHCEANGSATPL